MAWPTGQTTSLLLTLLLCGVTLAFDPGCSFVGDQCMYHVTLGHKDSCDATTATTSTAPSSGQTCCDDVTKMKTDMSAMQRQIGDLVEQLAGLTSSTTVTSNPSSHDNGQLQQQLNQTLAELEQVKSQHKLEVDQLRAELSNLTNQLQLCRAALGVASVDPNPGSLAGDVNMTYCGFNNGSHDLCGFTSLTSSDVFEVMKKGSSSDTGPLVDHSTGTLDHGQYLGLDAKKSATKHTTTSTSYSNIHWARIESGWLEPAAHYCVSFWYLMHGRDVQQLQMTVRTGGGTGYPVFSKTGEQSTSWHRAQVDLDREYTGHRFKIDFEASTAAYTKKYSSSSSSYPYKTRGDIAIDDIYIYNTTCTEALKCPANSHKYLNPHTNKTSCYTVHSTPMTWAEAADVCRREGPITSLVRVDSKGEQDFLVNLFNSDDTLRAVGTNGFYTAGNDLYTEHTFHWTDAGILETMTYTNWHTNQPNNVGGDQDCLLMEYPEDDYSWGDVGCWSSHPFVCEGHYD